MSAIPAPGSGSEDSGPAGVLAEARQAYEAGRLAAAAEAALRASTLAARRHDAGGVIDAALLWTGVPDPRSAASVVHICGSALAVSDQDDHATLARLHGQLSVALHLLERFADAGIAADAAASHAALTADPMATVAALHARQLAIAGIGGGPELLELGRRMLEAAEIAGDADAELLARSCRLEGLLRSGDTSGAGHEIAALDVLALRTGRPLDRWNERLARAGLEQATGQFAAAEQHAREARVALPPEQRPHTEPLFVAQLLLIATDVAVEPAEVELARSFVVGGAPIAIAMTGRFDLEVGDVARARLAFESVRPRLDDVALDRRGLPTLTAALELAAAFGDAEVADSIAERLAPFDGAMIVSALGAVGPVAHYLGLAQRLRGRGAAAVAHGTAAVELATRGGFAPWAARCRLAAAETMVADEAPAGVRAAAAREAALAGAAAAQLGMRGLRARAQALEDGITARGRLSKRELEIASLVASGSTNREIADRLVVSERTVESHVQHVLDKLGFRSRTQIAAWAVEADLPRPPDGRPDQ